MRPTTVFGLDTTCVQNTARSMLLLNGRPAGRVRGCRIDAQLEVGHGAEQGGFVVLICESALGCGADQRDKTLKSPVTPGSRACADLHEPRYSN